MFPSTHCNNADTHIRDERVQKHERELWRNLRGKFSQVGTLRSLQYRPLDCNAFYIVLQQRRIVPKLLLNLLTVAYTEYEYFFTTLTQLRTFHSI